MERIYLSPPDMGPRERDLLLDAFDSNWIAPGGPHVDGLEREVAEFLGVDDVAALVTGTAALHLALVMLGVSSGDEVLAPTFTFAATVNVIRYVGATPVLIDCDFDTWNMDPALLSEALDHSAKGGKLPKAVIVVDLYGQCADYHRIRAACEKYDIPIVEDAAAALGATYRGKAAGTLGNIGVISFNGNKVITTSGGGVLVASDTNVIERCRFLAAQARDPAPHYEHSEVGYNYRLSNLLAAVGRGQLAGLGGKIAARRRTNQMYREAFNDLDGVGFLPVADYGQPNFWLSCITIDPASFGCVANDVRHCLERDNIEARPLWKPMHMQPVYEGCRTFRGSVSESLFAQGLCLPSGSSLTDEQRDRVIAGVRSAAPA